MSYRFRLFALGCAGLTTAGAFALPATAASSGGSLRLLPRPTDSAVAAAVAATRGARSNTARRAAAGPQVVVTGLNNPRQLELGPLGALYIAEAGRGGARCDPDLGCIGATGSVSFVRHPGRTHDSMPRRIAKGFLSAAGPDGSFAVGSDGVSKNDAGFFSVIMTYAPPDVLPGGLPGNQAGKLLKVKFRSGRIVQKADVSAVEFNQNPAHDQLDSNPYAVLELPDNRRLVADAAGNDVISVSPSGKTSVFAVFADWDGHDPVPTSLARMPNGNVLVGMLGGEAPGGARVYELTKHGKQLRFLDGFTTVTGVAAAPDGSIYVSELFGGPDHSGQVTRVMPNGQRSMASVPFPAGVVVNAHGMVFVSAWSIADSDGADMGGMASPPGQVWRIHL